MKKGLAHLPLLFILLISTVVVFGIILFNVSLVSGKKEAGEKRSFFPATVKITSRVVSSPSPLPTATPAKITSCAGYSDANSLREFIFCAFGFRSEIAQRIRNTTTIEVEDMNSTSGGGFWYGGPRKVSLYTAQREAALHELSHAFWEDERGDQTRRLNLVKDLIQLATWDKSANLEYENAINFANEYVYGNGSWKGDFCSADGSRCVDGDRKNLTDTEILDYTNKGVINDHEIYAGFSSWTMGRLRSGVHKLPDFMAKNFDEEFSGIISEVPYFEGGPK